LEADGSLARHRDLGDAGELLDAAARAAYKRRLADLKEELEEAERFNDTGRVAKARVEIEALSTELARAAGLGGRGRRAASHAERARINVTRAIKKALAQIAAQDPALAHHLNAAIRTGRFCRYTPDPEHPIRWEL
jgi:non-specific serine/threonine protein kinase